VCRRRSNNLKKQSDGNDSLVWLLSCYLIIGGGGQYTTHPSIVYIKLFATTYIDAVSHEGDGGGRLTEKVLLFVARYGLVRLGGMV